MIGMTLTRQKVELALEILFFALIIAATFHTFVTGDFYFHIKTGEYIVTHHSLPMTDQFSYTVGGHPIVPYEWVHEVLEYLVYQNFGFLGVGIFSSLFLLIYIGIYRQILVEIFDLNFLSRVFLISVTVILNNPYWSERPQILAYCLYMVVLYVCLKRAFLNKNWLWLSIPSLLIWTNTHASMILGLSVLFGYSISYWIKKYRTSHKDDLKLAKDFSLYAIVGFIVTVLPPLGFGVYELLIKFFQNRTLISSFIDEWSPLYSDWQIFLTYAVIYVIALGSFIWVLSRKHPEKSGWTKNELLYLFLPLLPVVLFGLSGQRQSPFALPTLCLFLIPFIKKLHIRGLHRFAPAVLGGVLIVALIWSLNLFRGINTNDYKTGEQFYPKQSISFIQSDMKGNMLNDFGLGGYLLYRLGPDQKVFIDGRTEMYLPTLMTDAKGFADYKYTSEEDFLNYFNGVVKKYHVSWVILSSENFTVWRKLMHILYHQPNWHLVYFDDAGEIFATDDGVNAQTIAKHNMDVISPFQATVYKAGQEEKALEQFKSMQSRSPSSVALNSIGYILYGQKKIDEAKNYFIQAINYNPNSQTAIASRVNLAEVYAKEGNLNDAISMYQTALHMDSQRENAYLRLGQLIIQAGGSKQDAIAVWQAGIDHLQYDDGIKGKLQNLINQNQ
jgi:tetratricopeptide (TPR) repeat protein